MNGEGQHDESKRKIFYRRGFGSFRVNTMHQVKDMKELKTLLNTPDEQLPPAAKTANELLDSLKGLPPDAAVVVTDGMESDDAQ